MMLNSDFSYGWKSRQSEEANDRLKNEIRWLENQNEQIMEEMRYLERDPSELLQPYEEKLKAKIRALRVENQHLSNMMEKSKYPGYIEMTKKKTNLNHTPSKHPNQSEDVNLLDGWENQERRPFSEIDPNENEKYEVSTCMHEQANTSVQNPIQSLQPLHEHQLRNRTILTAEVLQVIERTEKMKEELEDVVEQNGNQSISNPRNDQRYRRIEEQKRKLIQFLQKLKKRERNMQQLTEEYEIMYEQTLSQLKQANALLKQLQETKVQDNIDDIYAEVLQLEERLSYINTQLQRLDQSNWLEEVCFELQKAVERLGIPCPRREDAPIRQIIDQLCQILIECNIAYRKDQNEKIQLLKIYHEEEKKNNKEIIQHLKNKEQALQKKLIDMQIQGES